METLRPVVTGDPPHDVVKRKLRDHTIEVKGPSARPLGNFFSANFQTLSGHRNDDSLYGAECLTFAEFPTYLKVEKPTYCEAAT
jgi:hypothetical protein